ncbi:MAG TPA: Spy/CpxP family protein refolding chaperone [Thermoanaerobaculia bacterium]|nr:Spy/CpxP family protein refolding chaperone [Thermoanaerobaculia bacterium]
MKRWFAVLVLLTAARAWGAPLDGKWWKNPRIVRELSLTEPQVDRIEAIFRQARPELIDLRADLEKKRLLQESAMEKPEVDPKEAERRIDDVEQARTRLAKARMAMLLEIRGVLTPGQRDRARELFQERREGRTLRPRPRSSSD